MDHTNSAAERQEECDTKKGINRQTKKGHDLICRRRQLTSIAIGYKCVYNMRLTLGTMWGILRGT